eukprot:gene20012-26727_t
MDDMTNKNIMDGDPFMSSTPSWRFSKPEEEYKELLETKPVEESSSSDSVVSPGPSPKEKIDTAW